MGGPIRIPQVKTQSVQQQPFRTAQTPISLGRNVKAPVTQAIARGVTQVAGAFDQVRRDANARQEGAQNELDKMIVTNAITAWHESTGVHYAEQSQSITRIDALPGVNPDGSLRPGFAADMGEFERDLSAEISKTLSPDQQAMFGLSVGRSRAAYSSKTAGHQASQSRLAQNESITAERDSFVFRASGIDNTNSPEWEELQDAINVHVNNLNLDGEGKEQLRQQLTADALDPVIDNQLFIQVRSDPGQLKADLEGHEFDPFLTEGEVSTWIDRADRAIAKTNTINLDAEAQPIIDDLIDNWDQVNTVGDGLSSNQTRRQIKEDYANEPELRDELLDRWDNETAAFRANEKRENDRAQASTRTAVDALIETRSFNDARLQVDLLPESHAKFKRLEKDRINDIEQGKTQKGNQTEYYRMLRLAGGTPAQRDEFLATNIGELNLLATNQNDLFDKARALIEGNDAATYQGFTLASIADDATRTLGLEEELTEQFNRRFNQEVEAFNRQPDRNGKLASPTELREIARGLSIQANYDGWFDFDESGDERVFQFEAGDLSGFEVEMFTDPRQVPINSAIEIRKQVFRDKGYTPNPQEVLEVFQAQIIAGGGS